MKGLFLLFLIPWVSTAQEIASASTSEYQPGVKTWTSFALGNGDSPHYPIDFKHFDYVNPKAPKGGVIRFVGDSQYATFVDNALAGETGEAPGKDFLHCSLMAIPSDDAYSRYPFAAKNLEVDDMSYVIVNLNEKATWNSPGEDKCKRKNNRVRPKRVTAEDVAFSFEVNKKFSTNGSQGRYKAVDSYQIISPTRIMFRLNKHDKETIRLLVGMGLYSRDFHKQPGHEFERKDRQNVPGCGPYVLKKANFDSIQYHRVCNWWGEKLPSQVGLSNFDEIRYESYQDDQVRDEAFSKGELDMLGKGGKKDWPPPELAGKIANGQITAHNVDFLGTKPTSTIEFNNETINDRRVRLALSTLYQREFMTTGSTYGNISENSYFSGIIGGTGSKDKVDALLIEIKKAHPESFPNEVFNEPYKLKSDPKDYPAIRHERRLRAIALMKEAGWQYVENPNLPKKQVWLVDTDPSNLDRKVWMKDGKEFPTIRFQSTCSGCASNLTYEADLKSIGFKVELRQISDQGIEKIKEKKQFDVTDSRVWHPDILGDETRNRWSSKYADIEKSSNVTRTRNPAIDDAVERAVNAKNADERSVAVGALDRLLQADVPSLRLIVLMGKEVSFRIVFAEPFPFRKRGNPTCGMRRSTLGGPRALTRIVRTLKKFQTKERLVPSPAGTPAGE